MSQQRKHLWINGFRAEVLSDDWVAVFRGPAGFHSAIEQTGEPIGAKQRRELCAQAEAMGYTEVEVQRHVYAAYDLRCTMSRRSGTRIYWINLKKTDAGWAESRSTQSNFY